MQMHGKTLNPVAYTSWKLLPREMAYCTIERVRDCDDHGDGDARKCMNGDIDCA